MLLDPFLVIVCRLVGREDDAVFPQAEFEIVQQGIDPGLGKVRIALQVAQRAEIGSGVAALGGADREVMRKRVVPGSGHLRVIREIPVGVEKLQPLRPLSRGVGELQNKPPGEGGPFFQPLAQPGADFVVGTKLARIRRR